MKNRFRFFVQVFCWAVMSTSASVAQLPTFSLEAVAIGTEPAASAEPTDFRAAAMKEFRGAADGARRITAGPVDRVVIAPGEVVSTKIFLRNWSPRQEQLSAYQAQIEPTGYASGTAGFVHPPNYHPEYSSQDEDLNNCYLNVFDRQFVHFGLSHLPLTDSVSNGYRWASILVRPDHGPVAHQDGEKYYCGSLNLIASDDASGTFTIGFIENTSATGLRDGLGIAIMPNAFEPLIVVVRPVDWSTYSLLESLVDGLNGLDDTAGIADIDIDEDEELATADLRWLIRLANRRPHRG